MKRIITIAFSVLVLLIAICGYSYFTDKSRYADWDVTTSLQDTAAIKWAPFKWINETINGKSFERTAMFIPCKVEGLPYNFTVQFDLGADKTGLYETSLQSLYKIHPQLKQKIRRLKSPLQFWNTKKTYELLQLTFGSYTAANKKAFFYTGYGEPLNLNSTTVADTFHIGTIGADLFKNKVLIIDYPAMRFAICNEVPQQFNRQLINIDLDGHGRVILPMQLNNKQFKIFFDNGSSLFPLTATSAMRANFSNNPVTDSIEVSSWGKKHTVTGRMITDSFTLAGKKFGNVKVYENHALLGIDKNNDATAGNYLFWNNIIVIDFKNKKFGIHQ